jgi:GntR family transcriptional regulator / MocR family aminotransferase
MIARYCDSPQQFEEIGSAMLVLNHDGRVPLYTQLYNRIKDDILSGKLPSHSKLPSVRDLAAELSVSRNTVESSYLELYSEGYIYSKPRSGYFVSALAQDAVLLSLPRKRRERDPLPELPAPCDIDFHPARLDPQAFPLPLWRRCILDSLRQSSGELIQYHEPQGELGLRSNIQKYLERSRGVVCDPEQIVICSGLQHSLDIVAHLLKERRPVVGVENPGYHLPRSVFRNHSFELIPIPVGSGGIDLDLLETSGSTIAYVTPSHQFPIGCVMPVANRLKLIEWAKSDGKLIIEDDYDSELRYHGKPIPSLQGLHPGGNIIYLGTFSKVLSPALRVSYLILPHSLLSAYRRLFQDYFCSVSLLEQRTLAEFMEQGHWDRHLRRMRTLYKKKHDALLRTVDRHFGDRAVIVGQGAGLHVVLQLTGHTLSEGDLIDRARGDGVGLLPFSVTHAKEEPDSSRFFLGFGGLTANEIELGIERLVKSWYD